MRPRICLLAVATAMLSAGCSKNSPETGSESALTQATGERGVETVGPDVGAVTPVSSSALDDASGGGVNSSAMKKAKGVAAQGVGSVNNAERQGYGAGGD